MPQTITEVIENNEESKVVDVEIVNEGVESNSIVELNMDTNKPSYVSTEVQNPENNKYENYVFEIISVTYQNNDVNNPIIKLKNLKTGEIFTSNQNEVKASFYPLVVVAIFVARVGIKQAVKKFGKSTVNTAIKKHGTKTSASKAVSKVPMSRLDYHWNKHRKEFGNISKSTYLNKARTLLGKPIGKNILEKKSTKKFNGKHRYYKYDKSTNEFLSVERNGNTDTIITYFKPKDGISYWKRQ